MLNLAKLVGIARSNILKCGKLNYLERGTTLSHSTMFTNDITDNPRKEIFQKVFPEVVDSIFKLRNLDDAKLAETSIKEILYYNVRGGKLSRGLTTVMTYEMLEKPENITEQSIKLSCVVGWCIEMMQAYFLMGDDIMDGSVTRRGVPCWYTLPGVGLRALNDGLIVLSTMQAVLKTHLGPKPQYVDMVELLNESLMLTSVGQHLDYNTADSTKHGYNLFTKDQYDAIVKYKTSYYTFKLPICAGMLLANINDEQLVKQVEKICLHMGRLFQIQDDFIDVYGVNTVTGKVGTDIQTGKCSWLAVTAFNLCNEVQKTIFKTAYGRSDIACIEKIKQLYGALNIPDLYKEEQQRCYNEVVAHVGNLDASTRLPEMFMKLLNNIYNREK